MEEDGRGGGWREHLAPVQEERSSTAGSGNENNDDNSSSSSAGSDYESDWEREVTARGDVLHVVPLSEPELLANKTTRRTARAQEDKKVGKLTRLVKRRESKRDRSSSAVVQNESSDGDSSTYGPIKTFESFFEGTSPVELIDVQLRLVVRSGRSGRPERAINLLEDMLGIIPGKSEPESDDLQFTAGRVVIAGLLPGGPASKLRDKLRIGDWLRTIDGQQISLENLDSVLGRYTSSCKVKLTVQRAAPPLAQIVNQEEDDQLLTPPSVAKIIMGQGPSPGDVQNMLRKLPYLALYMSRQGVTESSPELADVIYQFPAQQQSRLMQVRGLFLTLSHALPEITGSRPVTSSLLVDDQLIHVGYAEERDDLFVMALPALKASAKEVSQLVRDTVRVLRLRHRTLARAFSPKNNAANLNEFFSVLFLDTLLGKTTGMTSSASGQLMMATPAPPPPHSSASPLLDVSAVLAAPAPARFDQSLPAAHWLHLPDDVKFQIDDALSQLEAADFTEYSDDFYDAPREFNILGACLFHRARLLASHLTRDDMIDVLLWCQFNQILPLTRAQPVQQVVNWSEIFLTRRSVRGIGSSAAMMAPEAAEMRTFLLVVGLGHQVLGVLLETGGGGAALQGGVVRPDPFYVDQAMNTLEHLVDMGIPGVCNKWLTLPASPEILNVDALYEVAHAQKRLDAAALAAGRDDRLAGGSGVAVLKKTKSYEYAATDSPSGSLDESVSLNQSQSDGTSELSEDYREDAVGRSGGGAGGRSLMINHSGGEEEEDVEVDGDPSSFWELYHSTRRSQINFHEDSASGGGEEDVLHYQVAQLSVSPENTILHYLHLDVGEGVYLAPLSWPSGPYHSQVVENFRAACQIIHSGFQMTIRSKDLVKSREANMTSSSAPSPRPWLNKSLVAIKEQSMLFHLRPGEGESGRGSSLPLLSYWVAGRLFLAPHPRECYVCYHDSSPQVMVELAFRLAFGVHL